ncbi:MAG: type II toxin-antitoxin system HicB family antitoxin [Bacteroidota bacterium]
MTPADYPVTIRWSDADCAFVATVPDLPGCTAHGQTPTRAYYAALDAAEAWISTARETGRPVPEPSTDAD